MEYNTLFRKYDHMRCDWQSATAWNPNSCPLPKCPLPKPHLCPPHPPSEPPTHSSLKLSWFPTLLAHLETTRSVPPWEVRGALPTHHVSRAPCSYSSCHMPFAKSAGSTQRDTPAFHPLRAAILEKMPLVERGSPQADEEVKESKEATQLLEPAPVPTEPQVRRRKPQGEEDLVGLPCLALILLPFPHRPQSSWIC